MTNHLQNNTASNETQSEPLMLAWGFSHLFDNVRHCDYRALRQAVTNYLGSTGTYHRYHRGERLLTPEQQQAIQHIFQSYGYTEPCRYDCKMRWSEISTRWSENPTAPHGCHRLMNA
ncbi:MAG: hypothetical protein IJ637_03555 [Prevotella sp.]|nr:hypothetical protein [Prevotella sp.]